MQHEFGTLNGLRALVTGASSGIGKAIAQEFAHAGADVILHCSRTRQEITDFAAVLAIETGRRIHVETADFLQLDELDTFADRVWNIDNGLEILVNNAGVDNLTGEAAQLNYSQKLHRLLDVDVRASMLLSRAIGQRMHAFGKGTILNIGWDQADRGMEGDSGELFAAAKNAIMGFTRSLACSLAPQVRVNCIAPGWIRTAWGAQANEVWQQRVIRETPLARWGEPEDIAKLARFLASQDATYITGQVINANGGAIR